MTTWCRVLFQLNGSLKPQCSADQVVAQAAVHALANLTAFRSAATSESRFASLRRTSSKFSNHPSTMVSDSEAIARLMALLHCPDAAIVAPAVALLNNLCAENENRDKVLLTSNRLIETLLSADAIGCLLLCRPGLHIPDSSPKCRCGRLPSNGALTP